MFIRFPEKTSAFLHLCGISLSLDYLHMLLPKQNFRLRDLLRKPAENYKKNEYLFD